MGLIGAVCSFFGQFVPFFEVGGRNNGTNDSYQRVMAFLVSRIGTDFLSVGTRVALYQYGLFRFVPFLVFQKRKQAR